MFEDKLEQMIYEVKEGLKGEEKFGKEHLVHYATKILKERALDELYDDNGESDYTYNQIIDAVKEIGIWAEQYHDEHAQ